MARTDRLASVIKREVAEILLKKMTHHSLGVLSILRVKLSDNLSEAWVYYSQFGSLEEREKTRKVLDTAKGFIRSELGKALFTQRIPQLHFEYDDSIEKTQNLINRIDELSKL